MYSCPVASVNSFPADYVDPAGLPTGYPNGPNGNQQVGFYQAYPQPNQAYQQVPYYVPSVPYQAPMQSCYQHDYQPTYGTLSGTSYQTYHGSSTPVVQAPEVQVPYPQPPTTYPYYSTDYKVKDLSKNKKVKKPSPETFFGIEMPEKDITPVLLLKANRRFLLTKINSFKAKNPGLPRILNPEQLRPLIPLTISTIICGATKVLLSYPANLKEIQKKMAKQYVKHPTPHRKIFIDFVKTIGTDDNVNIEAFNDFEFNKSVTYRPRLHIPKIDISARYNEMLKIEEECLKFLSWIQTHPKHQWEVDTTDIIGTYKTLIYDLKRVLSRSPIEFLNKGHAGGKTKKVEKVKNFIGMYFNKLDTKGNIDFKDDRLLVNLEQAVDAPQDINCLEFIKFNFVKRLSK